MPEMKAEGNNASITYPLMVWKNRGLEKRLGRGVVS